MILLFQMKDARRTPVGDHVSIHVTIKDDVDSLHDFAGVRVLVKSTQGKCASFGQLDLKVRILHSE
jgi:hypothetical protein